MKLAFFKVGELQGNLRHLKVLLEYLKGRGVELKEIELDPQNVQKAVEELQEFKPAFTMDVNATGIVIGEQDGKKIPIYDLFGFVHLSFFTEDPLLHFPNLYGVDSHRNLVALVTDIKYADSLKFLGVENISYITPFLDFSLFPQPSLERDIEIAFLGPVIAPEIVVNSVRRNLPDNIFPLFIETGEFMFRNPEVHVLTALNHILSIFNPQFQQEFMDWRQKNEEAFLRLLNDISIYATMRKRWYLINFLEGVNLKVIGEFQGELKEDHEHVKVNSFEELLDIYGRTNITVLSFPHTVPSGIGFTPLEVSAMGSAPMLDFRGTLPGFLVPEEEAIAYMPLDRADIEEKLLYYLENPEEARGIGERARNAVVNRYRVDDRGEFIYGLMKDIIAQAEIQAKREETDREKG
ncbi:glycosyl transferase family 1 [Hydrogenivirga caldilitoris]|uniref:Glycosyl transferase family 1 n=1 Tax=Hydrogenivirga caldilitoris TaxID=246264 RepID=A0A497XMP4_9AQUI|nr:glycosyltransferase [Hydrogenivirga caldilitoris]RLJ70206.1 glycosyl transferase family 1 [Hydrogenivirga caldilitoris]